MNIRNIGIVAHIDAGKTTLTERILHYAGMTKRLGEVDRGDTVMDYLPQERDRGITIKAAAISFPWRSSVVNLIDTPGHVDFTMEVERAVRVMDGAVAVLDGSQGVEAQTVTVWQQADRYRVPRIVFCNKMDKIGADYDGCLLDVASRFRTCTLPLTVPVHAEDSLVGVYDYLEQEIVTFDGLNGCLVNRLKYSNSFYANKRRVLLESMAELDELFLEEYLENQQVDAQSIKRSVKKLLSSNKAVPCFAGAAFRNIGVQLLMDSVIDYLPEPPPPTDQHLRALAFKVVFDPQRGLMVYVRVYSGKLQKQSTLYTKSKKERVSKILRVYGNEFKETEELHAGEIGVLLGCKHTATGDTLSDHMQCEALPGIPIPTSVIQVALQVTTKSEEDQLKEAIKCVCLEDPSLTSHTDLQTGQLVLGGMGELHLEVSGKKIASDYKIKGLQVGKVRIAYKETLSETIKGELQFERVVNDLKLTGLVSLCIEPLPYKDSVYLDDRVIIHANTTDVRSPKHIDPQEFIYAVKEGIETALLNGPIRNTPLSGLEITVTKLNWIDANSTPSAIRHCAIQLLQNLGQVHSAKYRLLEPFMSLNIRLPNSDLGTVLPDIHSVRRGIVYSYEPGADGTYEISAEAPLSELIGYVTWLRTATSGRATLSMRLKGYRA